MIDDLKLLDDLQRKAIKKRRQCMYGDCKCDAIKSHVLQKNGILNKIAKNGHLYERQPTSWFNIFYDGVVTFKRVGLNNAYTFNGFCNNHDTAIFKPIEVERKLDLNSNLQQALFCYRGLCQEIRRKEIVIDIFSGNELNLNPLFYFMMNQNSRSEREGIENLLYFKKWLEDSILINSFDQFYFETIQIPLIELCISVPLNIYDPDNSKSENSRVPFVTSFINVFPKEENSYVIVGYHKDYPCNWTDSFVTQMKSRDKAIVFKALSDLLSLRLEFWLMSESLFINLSKRKIEELKEIICQNTTEFSKDLNTGFNLFADL
ncbi:MAG: hypothetical protein RIS29_1688 [Bacteroidota bacterium]|jgi:hypothetical protein